MCFNYKGIKIKHMTNIDQLINTLTLDEKVSLLSGFNSWYTNKIDNKNIPSIKMSDGPNGVRGDSNLERFQPVFHVQYH